MTVAVLLPARGREASAPPVLALAAQWRDAGAGACVELPGDVPTQLRRIAALARESTGPLLLCGTDVLAHTAVLLTVATEPGGGSVALVGTAHGPGRPGYARVRESRGFVTAAWAAAPEGAGAGSDDFLGVLRVGAADLPALAEAADRLAAGATADRPAGSTVDRPAGSTAGLAGGGPVGVPGSAATAADLLLPALVAAGRRVGASRLRLLVADRVSGEADAAEVRARMAAVDEDAARLRLAVKERDDFFTTYFVSPISPYAVRAAARAGLSPTAVTGISVTLALVAALGFAWGHRAGLVGGAVLLYLSFVLDCVDGQLARYSRRFSAFGGWLDTMADRSKEYVVYAGLAIGAERAGLGEAWPLAVAAMVLQTVRHMTDTWYGALHDEAAVRQDRRDQGAAAGHAGDTREPAPDHADLGRGIGGRLGRVSERVQADTGSLAYWLKRIVVFPIGERWALIGLTAALFDGRIALIAVLVWGGLAFAYTLGLRSLRARGMRVPVMTVVDTARHRDDGPLARALGSIAVRGHDRAGSGQPVGMFRRAAPLAGALGAVLLAAMLVTADRVSGGVPGGAAGVLVIAAGIVAAGGLTSRLPHDRPLDWLVPAGLRAAEYLFVVGAGRAHLVPWPVLFVLLFALALRHYDLTARMEKRAAAAPARPWDAGWDGRVAILAVGAAAGLAAATVVVLAAYVVAVFGVGALGALGARAAGDRPAAVAGGPAR